ncbi:hypothetical protein FISHEDRAFT_54208, partial [Fistulina hepatica ATCC 64428]
VVDTIIWELTQELCEKKGCQWPEISEGKIIVASLAAPCTAKGDLCKGMARLYKIIITESAYLIWKLRCERRITNEDDEDKWQTLVEIENRWLAAINSRRLEIDRPLTNRNKYGRRALSKDTVLRTWCDTLLNEDQLPRDWITSPRV